MAEPRQQQQAQPSEPDRSLYTVITQIREKQRRPVSRILIAGYINETVMQKEKVDL